MFVWSSTWAWLKLYLTLKETILKRISCQPPQYDGICSFFQICCWGCWPWSVTPGGYSQINWVGVCSPLPKTLTLFMTKICDFPDPIYDPIKNCIPYLRPDPQIRLILKASWRAFVHGLIGNDEKIVSSEKTHPYPIYDQSGSKTIPFGAAQTYNI